MPPNGLLRYAMAQRLAADILRGSMRSIRDRHTRGGVDDSKQIWMLLIRELWRREFIDRVSSRVSAERISAIA